MRVFQRQMAERKAAILGFQRDRPPTEDAPEDPRQLYALATILRYALVIGLCGCAALVLALAAQQVAPGSYVGLLPMVCLLIVVDILVLTPQLSKLSVLSKEWFLQNGSRWLLIIALLKLLTYLGQDWHLIVRELPLLRSDPYLYFITAPFMTLLFSVLLIWTMARTLSFDLAQMTEGEKKMETLPDAGMRTDRSQWRQSLCSHVLGFGAFITAIAAGSFWLAQFRGNAVSTTWISIDLLIYFTIALALLGHTQMTILRTNWLWERTPIAGNLVRRWTLYGMAFLGILAVLSLLLPVGSLDLLIPALNFLFQLLFYVVQVIAFVFVGLAQLVLSLLALLFGRSEPAPMNVPPPAPPFTPPPIADAVPMPAWYETLQTIIFFTILAIVLFYVVRFVILQHRGLREALAKLPIVIWLRALWRNARQLWHLAKEELVLWISPANGNAQAVAPAAAEQEPLPAFDDLAAREQVIALYVHTLQQAGEQGLPRKPGQTPTEYARTLAINLPEASGDMNDLTEQFATARYSAHPIQSEHVSLTQRCVQRITQWLRDRQSK